MCAAAYTRDNDKNNSQSFAQVILFILVRRRYYFSSMENPADVGPQSTLPQSLFSYPLLVEYILKSLRFRYSESRFHNQNCGSQGSLLLCRWYWSTLAKAGRNTNVTFECIDRIQRNCRWTAQCEAPPSHHETLEGEFYPEVGLAHDDFSLHLSFCPRVALSVPTLCAVEKIGTLPLLRNRYASHPAFLF